MHGGRPTQNPKSLVCHGASDGGGGGGRRGRIGGEGEIIIMGIGCARLVLLNLGRWVSVDIKFPPT